MKTYCENCEHEFEFGEEILVYMDKFAFCGDNCFIDSILEMGIERRVWTEEMEEN